MNRQSSTNKKRATLFSVLLSAIFIFAMISTMLIVAEAKDNPTMTLQVSQVSAFAGETVQVKINLVGNPGVASLKINVAYENFLTLQNIEYNPSLGGQANSSNYQQNGSPATLIWVNAFEDFTDDAVFATLTFKIAEDAEEDAVSEISVSYDEDDIYNSEEENIALTVMNGSVFVQSSIPGDINGDRKVNNKDITRMFQHLANWGVLVNSSVLDVNGDGKINNKDITRLFQYLANWDVDIYPISYVVTFNGNGGTLVSGKETQTVKKVAVNKVASAVAPVYEKEGYAFDGFDNDFSNVTANITVNAKWKETHVHTVEFIDYDGMLIDVQAVGENASATAPEDPERSGYRFIGWSHAFDCVTEDIIIEAQYVKQYMVSFFDFNGELIYEYPVDEGSDFHDLADLPTVESVIGNYNFSGWDNQFEAIDSDQTVRAVYHLKTYTVQFLMPDGTPIEDGSITVSHGYPAEAPLNIPEYYYSKTSKRIYTFTGWDTALDQITEDTQVKAIYASDYSQPVLLVEFVDKDTVRVSIQLSSQFSLYTLDFSLDYNAQKLKSSFPFYIEDCPPDVTINSNARFLWKNENHTNENKLFNYVINNNTNIFSFIWASSNGVNASEMYTLFDTVNFTGINENVLISNHLLVSDATVIISSDGGETFDHLTPMVLYIDSSGNLIN